MAEPLYMFYVQSFCFFIIYYLVLAFIYLCNLIISANIRLFFLMFLLIIFLSSGNVQCLIRYYYLLHYIISMII